MEQVSVPRVPLGLFAAPLLVTSSLIVAAQTPSITTTTDLVVVPALVREASGNLVQSLRASDFLLTDNGVPQTITIEDAERQPLSIVVIMQTGESAPSEFPNFIKLGTMLTYLTANRPYQIAMVTFDSRPEEQWDFTSNIANLEDGFAHPGPGDDKAAILDAVAHGIDLLREEPRNRRRLIILLSQTDDDGSVTHAEDLIRRLGENNITIDCLTFSPEKAWLKDQFTKERQENKPYQYGVNGPKLIHTFNLDKPLRIALSSMRDNASSSIAVMSGGESLPFTTKAELEQGLATLANHLAATYTISFKPHVKEVGFHTLQLHAIGKPQLQISARTSYWSSDPLLH